MLRKRKWGETNFHILAKDHFSSHVVSHLTRGVATAAVVVAAKLSFLVICISYE